MCVLLTTHEVALVLHCSVAQVRSLMRSRFNLFTQLPAIKAGRRLMVPRAALEHWMAENKIVYDILDDIAAMRSQSQGLTSTQFTKSDGGG